MLHRHERTSSWDLRATDRNLNRITRTRRAQCGVWDWSAGAGKAVWKRAPSQPTVVEPDDKGISVTAKRDRRACGRGSASTAGKVRLESRLLIQWARASRALKRGDF